MLITGSRKDGCVIISTIIIGFLVGLGSTKESDMHISQVGLVIITNQDS